jgi:SpoIID/LytB domain protein
VWTGPGRPYLASVKDDGPAAAAHSSWKYDAPAEALLRALNGDLRTRIGARLDGMTVVARDGAGRAERVLLRGTVDRTVRGEDLRDALAATLGARAIRSTRFEISERAGTFVFEGRGFGHGVGLCQAGALARIRAGQQVPAVLQIYFPGTKIVTLRGGV